MLAKFNSAGDELWKTQFGSTSYSVAVDTAGNAYVAVGGALAKFNSAGHGIWRSPYIANDALWVTVDSADDINLAGFTYADGEMDALLAKFNSAGEELWRTQYGSSSGPDSGSSVAVDSAGYVYLTCHSGHTDNFKAFFEYSTWLAKFDFAGSELWNIEYGTDQPPSRWAHAVAVNAMSDVYVSGYIGEQGYGFPNHEGAYLVKLSPIPEPSARMMLILFSASIVFRRRFVRI